MRRAEVRKHLCELIDQGAPGAALPSERSLSEQWGVSRPTLRAAMDDLAREGLIIRQHGRGTFSNPRKIAQELSPLVDGNFTAPPAEGGWRSEVVEFGIEPAGARRGHRLEVSPSEELLHVVRVRIVDERPMAIEKMLFPARMLPAITAEDFESGSLYQLFRARFELVAATAEQIIEPTVTDAEESRLLGVPQHAPALLFQRTTRDPADTVIEHTRSIYRGDRYRITTHLTLDVPTRE